MQETQKRSHQEMTGEALEISQMGESGDTHSEEEKALPEKNKKRRLKTPSQVEALERFYNEHKYPSESMKSELAEELGLSEKQISGWFCHRRLKDKKLREEVCANGRQDISSGVIQEHGSGLRQDSCSSTKQGDYRHFDPREVESRSLYGQDYPVTDITYENRGQYMHAGHYGTVGNTSSGSSSASQDMLLPLSGDRYDMEPSRYHSRNSNNMPMDLRGVQNPGYMSASEYLNLQDEVEHAPITAVKRQLGRQYREDGPPLSVEFQPLPPGAFESPFKDPLNDPYYVGDPIQQDSHSIPRTSNAHGTDIRYDRYNSNRHAQGPSPEGSQLRRTMWESDPRDEFPSFRQKQKSSVTNYCNHAPDWNSALDVDEDSAGETSGFNSRRNHGTRSKHGVEGMRSDFATDQRFRLYSGKGITSESSYPQLHNYDNTGPNVFQRREYFESKPSNLELLRHESLDNEDRRNSRMVKCPDERTYVDRRMGNEYGNQVQLKLPLKNEMRMARRIRGDEFLPRENVSKTPSPQALLPWTNLMKGSAVETPTSFSEDETEGTSSSTG
ncbi:homeobox-DDT domain protein RLT1-like [Telopea speciosissima]|uniref:homeobox-DDT domain protein RLT1-like n=1 Tax=Telopea speciosissima TaxID=54955 RepID=UPI001CC58628|nr:homeobox-DDT domain protein RLT1-like [Telopea speciosissima]